jgi:hypothetical protein
MRNKLDNLLLGLLWILVSLLGLCFWFNIQFGFNLLSSSHWQHLSYMQATRTPITPLFYISLVIGVLFILVGLYMVIRPKFRKIKLPTPQPDTQTQTQTQTQTTETPPPPATDEEEFSLSRPKRLTGTGLDPIPEPTTTPVAPAAPLTAPVAPPQTVAHQTVTPTSRPQQATYPEINEIFESAGYTVKQAPRVKGTQTALLAIGSGETIWLGAVGIKTTTMHDIVESLQEVFYNTLEDVEITVHSFVINPQDMSAPAPDVLTFATTDELRQYMQDHTNPPTDPDMVENFNAFSEYISTVVDYLGRM